MTEKKKTTAERLKSLEKAFMKMVKESIAPLEKKVEDHIYEPDAHNPALIAKRK